MKCNFEKKIQYLSTSCNSYWRFKFVSMLTFSNWDSRSVHSICNDAYENIWCLSLKTSKAHQVFSIEFLQKQIFGVQTSEIFIYPPELQNLCFFNRRWRDQLEQRGDLDELGDLSGIFVKFEKRRVGLEWLFWKSYDASYQIT